MPGRLPFRLVVIAAVGVAVATGAGVAAAQAPTVPTVPVLPPIPGSQTERFRLVLEGETLAIRDLDVGGTNTLCNATVNANITERATWRRGRGVTVAFTRLGTGRRAPILVRRVGSRGIPLFTVVVQATRTSSGSGVRTPLGPPEACPPVTEDLSKGDECGIPQDLRSNVSLEYLQGHLEVKLRGLGSVTDIRCPVSEVYGGTPELEYSWPTPPDLREGVLPASRIFGRARAFAVRLTAVPARSTETITRGNLTGSATDFGRNRVTVRFIRL
ncbi:MAG: hypothetical protein AB7V62_05640 [Thermoleophilia bacterium]